MCGRGDSWRIAARSNNNTILARFCSEQKKGLGPEMNDTDCETLYNLGSLHFRKKLDFLRTPGAKDLRFSPLFFDDFRKHPRNVYTGAWMGGCWEERRLLLFFSPPISALYREYVIRFCPFRYVAISACQNNGKTKALSQVLARFG